MFVGWKCSEGIPTMRSGEDEVEKTQLTVDKGKQTEYETNIVPQMLDTYCTKHDKDLLYFCRNHQNEYCEACVDEDHQNCCVFLGAEIEFSSHRCLKRVKRIRFDLEERESDLRNDFRRLKFHLSLAADKIQDIFFDIRKNVDETEKEFLKKLEKAGDGELSSISSTLDQAIKLKNEIYCITREGDKLNYDIVKVRQTAKSSYQCEDERKSSYVISDYDNKGTSELMKFSSDHEEQIQSIEKCLKTLDELCSEISFSVVEKHENIIMDVVSKVKQIITIASSRSSGKLDPELKSIAKYSSVECLTPASSPLRPSGKLDPKLKSKARYSSVECLTAAPDPLRPVMSDYLLPSPQKPVTQFVADREFSCSGAINAIKFVPNADGDLLVVTQHPNRLQLLSSCKSQRTKCIDLLGRPRDLCLYGSNVAVTFPVLKHIIVYNTTDLSKQFHIQVSDECYGICRVDNSFVITLPDKNIVRNVNDKNKILNETDVIFRHPRFVILSGCGQYLLISDVHNHRVVAMGRDLQSIRFIIRCSDLREPRGLSASPDGGVYICSFGKSCIVEFTKNGLFASVVVSTEQGINSPHSLCYNSDIRRLAVAPLTGNIQIFKGK